VRLPIWDVVVGDVREVLRGFPSDSVHCIVTSPPYHALRDYEGHPGQIGLEPTFDEWVATMVAVFREARRVLRPDGTLWLNVGKSYAGNRSFQGKTESTDGVFDRRAKRLGSLSEGAPEGDDAFARRDVNQGGLGHRRDPAFKDADLVMQGHLLAEALRRDGWWLRSDCIWHKNSMPESISSRPANTHENVFLLAKSRDYFFDMEPVRSAAPIPKRERKDSGKAFQESQPAGDRSRLTPVGRICGTNASGANLRTVWADVDDDVSAEDFLQDIWEEFLDIVGERISSMTDVLTISNEPFPGSHFAVFSTKLVERCIKAGTSERGCCPTCQAPWRRIVEKGEPDREHQFACGSDADGAYLGESTKGHDAAGVQDASEVKARILAGMRKRTSRWVPSCDHVGPDGQPLEPIPCLVMDPFLGSGRTLKTAVALGRDGVGIELVEKYEAMARANIADPLWEKKERARIRAERASQKIKDAEAAPSAEGATT
jgi:DNA modification methylase